MTSMSGEEKRGMPVTSVVPKAAEDEPMAHMT